MKTLPFILLAIAVVAIGRPDAACAATIPVTSAGAFTYGWEPSDGPTPEFDTDPVLKDASVIVVHENPGGAPCCDFFYASLEDPDSSGTITWHFQADAGLLLSSDFTVQGSSHLFGNGGTITGSWATDIGGPYTDFFEITGAGHQSGLGSPVSLSDTGFAGGTDLFVSFDLDRPAGSEDFAVQLFRDGSPDAGDVFIVTGTVTSATATVPEPSAFFLAALGLAGLGVVVWRRRKRV